MASAQLSSTSTPPAAEEEVNSSSSSSTNTKKKTQNDKKLRYTNQQWYEILDNRQPRYLNHWDGIVVTSSPSTAVSKDWLKIFTKVVHSRCAFDSSGASRMVRNLVSPPKMITILPNLNDLSTFR